MATPSSGFTVLARKFLILFQVLTFEMGSAGSIPGVAFIRCLRPFYEEPCAQRNVADLYG